MPSAGTFLLVAAITVLVVDAIVHKSLLSAGCALWALADLVRGGA